MVVTVKGLRGQGHEFTLRETEFVDLEAKMSRCRRK